jgi:Zn-dependent protease with chaperone function
MNFFEHQDDARRQTKKLVIYFALSVMTIVTAIYITVLIIFNSQGQGEGEGAVILWQPEVLGMTSLCILLLVGGGSFYKISQLSQGGSAIAEMLGGRLVVDGNAGQEERQLLNIVEEMSIASGTPIPQVYILEERGINAFAAGNSTSDAAIGVTRGCLELLNRDEMQGVIAHEFSHILNGDMKLNLRLIGMVHGIILISLLGYYILYGSSTTRRSKDSGGIMLFALALLIIGGIGTLCGNLIKSAISRQREFLADASAVQFTRNPKGIGGALAKIGGISGSEVTHPGAQETSHMFFGSAISSWFATHPPVEERITRIDKAILKDPPQIKSRPGGSGGSVAASGLTSGFAGAAVSEHTGQPQTEDLIYAGALIKDLPKKLFDAIHESYGAQTVVFALLMDEEKEVRKKQFAMIKENCFMGMDHETKILNHLTSDLPKKSYVPVVDMCLPALREMDKKQYHTFRKCLKQLIYADNEVSFFEYTLHKIVLHNLDTCYKVSKPPKVKYQTASQIKEPIALVLSQLAHCGHDSPAVAQVAFEAASAALGELKLIDEKDLSFKVVDKALDKMAEASAQLKQKILTACVVCAVHDGVITTEEGELLRALAETMDCPLPPNFLS